MTLTDTSVAELLAALRDLSDVERGVLEAHAVRAANHFADAGQPRVADLMHRAAVVVAEEGDRRRDLAEHARVQLDGDEVGSLLADDPESLAALAELPDLDD